MLLRHTLVALLAVHAAALQLTVIEQTLHARHRPPPNAWQNVEKPERLVAAGAALRAASLDIEWRRAVDSATTTPADAVSALKRVHELTHLRTVEAMSRDGGGGFDTDTYCAPGSWEAMLDGTRAWVDALALAVDARGPAFALCRPAGHHAGRATAMGFGLVNFACAAVAAALDGVADGGADGAARIAVLDWDAHHGNGVAAWARDEPRVAYCSLHEAGGFPGTGTDEAERGPHGNLLNLPLPKGASGACYREALREKALPFLLGRGDAAARPRALLVCAGYDALAGDPLATMALSPDDFRASIEMVAGEFGFPRERIALGLEGGYALDPHVGMPAGLVATCAALTSR